MTASISVIESSGRLVTPTAILECFPISPNISKNKSEAALITFGCAVNSETEFTNPDSLTILETLSKLPTSLLSALKC